VSQIRLYIDEDSFDKSLVAAFRNADFDVITVADASQQGYSDEEQLTWAAERGRVIYSYNRRDFCILHSDFLAMERNHAGIIVLRQQRYSIGQQLRGLLALIALQTAEDMVNQLVFLSSYIDGR
jgi:Domain of unknown function (DUF5615)